MSNLVVPPYLPPDAIGGPLNGCNGADRPTLAEARGGYQSRRARELIVCALRRHILYSSLSGRMLQGEFAEGAGSHNHRLTAAYPLLLPFNASAIFFLTTKADSITLLAWVSI